MELKEFLSFLRRWAWLLILGTVLGAAAAYAFSFSQAPVYQASTKIMVIQPDESLATDLTNLTDIELAETFRTLLVTEPVLTAAGNRVGGSVGAGQVSSRLIEGTLLLQVTARDGNSQRAADIANALVESLIEQNDTLQASRFAASEESLQVQITQVEEQLAALRQEGQSTQPTEEELADQQQSLENDILEMNGRIADIESEIGSLASNEVLVELTEEQRSQLTAKQARLALLQLDLEATKTRYTDLVSLGESANEQRVIESDIIEILAQITQLENEISDLNKGPEQSDNRSDLRAELALLQLNLDVANERYLLLALSDNREASDTGGLPQFETNIALYEQIYSSLLSNFEAVRLARVRGTPNIVQVEQATPAGRPVQPRPMRSAILGAAAGLFVAAGIAFLTEYLDDTLKTPEDIDRAMGLPVIGYMADTSDLRKHSNHEGPFIATHPRAPLAEAFRSLRTNLEFADVNSPLKTLLVTSPGPGEGKTTIAANLAAVFSQQQKRVVLLDCDLRRPGLHKMFNIPNDKGLSNICLDQIKLTDAAHGWSSSLAVITSGDRPSNPVELLGSEKMTQVLEGLKEVADVIVIDSPPSIVSDAAVLSAKVDGVIMVVQPGHTRTDAAAAQLEQLYHADARVVGVALNRIPRKQTLYSSRYYYNYDQNYYSPSSEDDSSTGDDQPDNRKGEKRRFGGLTWLRALLRG